MSAPALRTLARWMLVLATCALSCDGTWTCDRDERQENVATQVPPEEIARASRATSRERSELERRAASIRAALVSVEYHAMRDPPQLAPELMPIPLMRAAEILREDADDNAFGESRRRRSITALVVAGLDPTARPLSIRHREEIDVLLGPNKPEFEDFLEGLDLDLPPDALEDEIQGFQDRSGPAVRECNAQNAKRIFPRPEPPISKCGTSYPEDLIWEQARIDVSRPGGVAALARALDPQHWDETLRGDGITLCNPFFFAAYVLDASGNKMSCPPTAGEDWSEALYEYFGLSMAEIEGQLETDLAIETDLDPDPPTPATSHRFDYCLQKSYLGSMKMKPPAPEHVWEGSIDVDEGFQTIEKTSTGPLRVLADKRVHFANWADQDTSPPEDKTEDMNDAVRLDLQAMQHALKEAVCCEPPDPPECPPDG